MRSPCACYAVVRVHMPVVMIILVVAVYISCYAHPDVSVYYDLCIERCYDIDVLLL